MNEETLNSVCEDDWPQKTRNALRKSESTEYRDSIELKLAINNFLWCRLPMRTTLREAEILACKIFALMQEEIDK